MITSFKNKTFLITGGYGFIGSHLARRLLNLQARIILFIRTPSNFWRLKDIIKNIETYEIDIRDRKQVQDAIKKVNPDYIFHLAAYGVNSAHTDYMHAIETNIIGTCNIIQAAKLVNCKKIINFGSSSEYGNKMEPIHENMLLTPVDIYGSTKAAATILAHQIASENSINLITLRPFGIFGESEEPHKIFSYIILQVLQNKDVNLTFCNQLRDYCYIENIIDACILAVENTTVQNEIFNIGSGTIYPLKHYVELLFKHLKTNSRPNYGAIPSRTNERWVPEADVQKIKNSLSWEPRINIEEGIIKTVNWYKNNKHLYLIP
ncbi:TPA: NAD(P)-dependent oxidoreductase [Bacillus cereus]|uniref:NAD-dependent epimerase/dehydratase family protein n=2 Tax=Bacillus thuringiensis TaxID=1428 RepID=UPI000A37A9C3|nr:NAD(P)-dependent oxidoreductase [Bacillus thuringiensis]HDR8488118.1 NAD(P)-dependent oxidoreductase [Bacillus cereus]MED2129063.1 NAD(P)-dependent oxidoreductase [Bacillus thuringiensis]MED2175744.1 NAD(P)-dependent oxidoreductase [Bacillus thuringiensis]MED2478847.1 NAD(P)-dependent oxidoreductase [Bacillus thuringiensis]MED2578674.1 NAD(P)-dependent oxidoreductase [Bacillus thuringiensis]